MQGFGSRLLGSIKGIFIGLVIFVAAFPVLWWGEGRQNLAEFVEEATAIESKGTPSVEANSLIKTTGIITSPQKIQDAKFLPGFAGDNVLQLNRNVEMYAWKETVTTTKNGDKETKTYTYDTVWTSSPSDSSRFHEQAGHTNPKPKVKNEQFRVSQASVGDLAIDAAQSRFYKTVPLVLKKPDVITMHGKEKTSLSGDGTHLYLPIQKLSAGFSFSKPRNVAAAPKVGDLRLSYDHYPANQEGSVVGRWSGSKIVPHIYDKTDTFLGIYPGSPDLFAAYLHQQHKIMTWFIRIASFIMLWIGLNMVLGPVFFLIGAIPIVGELGKGMISIMTGAIAFGLWLLTLLLANFWLILIILLALGIGLLIYAKKKDADSPPQVPAEAG